MAGVGKPDGELPENARIFKQAALHEGFRKALDAGKHSNDGLQFGFFRHLFVEAVGSFLAARLSFFDEVVSELSKVNKKKNPPEEQSGTVSYNHPITINKDQNVAVIILRLSGKHL